MTTIATRTIEALNAINNGALLTSIESHRLNNLVRLGLVDIHENGCVAFVTEEVRAYLY